MWTEAKVSMTFSFPGERPPDLDDPSVRLELENDRPRNSRGAASRGARLRPVIYDGLFENGGRGGRRWAEIRRPGHDQDIGQEGERTTMFSPGSWKSRLEKKPGRSVTVENGISIVRTGTTVLRNEQRSGQLRWIVK